MAAKKNNRIVIIIVALLLVVALIAVIFCGKKTKEPAPVSADETIKEPTVVEEFENGDKVVMDASGETYIEPEYSPGLVEAAHQWADKGNRKFANDSDMIIEFMADDAYIDYMINGPLSQEEEPENGDKVVMDASGETYIEPEYSPDLVEAAHQWASKVDRKFADDNDMVHGFMVDDAYITYIIYGTLNPDEEPVQQQPQQQPQQKPQQQGNQGQQQQQPTQQQSDGGSKAEANDFFGVEQSRGAGDGEVGNSGDWELPGNVHVE